ncbi:MAG: hypothetical protein HKN89_01065 [Eudoraea sp.]|nr:hypothetical protein [Eudoraea sp.]
MHKYWILPMLFFFVIGCKPEREEVQSAPSNALAFEISELPQTTPLRGKALQAADQWSEFKSFDNSFQRIYGASGREEYALVVEELLEQFEALKLSVAPTELESEQISSRFNVVKTYLLKVQALLEYRIDSKEATQELISAYSNAMDQCNILVNNTLDTKTLFDE